MNWPLLKQIWIVSGLAIDFVGQGMVFGYTPSLLAGLRAEDSPLKLDLNTASWLGSVLGLSRALGICINSILMERYGRRWVHAVTMLTNLIAWLLQFWATNIQTFMFARILAGFSNSGYITGSVIIAEYTTPKYRGIFLNIKTVTMFSGYLIMHILGHYMHWRTVALMGTIPCICGFLINLTWPESPSWLASKNRFEECEEKFYWLRGRGEKAVKELEAMIRAQKLRMGKRPESVTLGQKTKNFFKKFRRMSLLKPLGIIISAAVVKESSGRHFFPVYALDIMSQLMSDQSNHFFYIILIDVISLTGACVACILVKFMGRRTLLMLSGIPAILLMLLMSSTLFMVSRGILTIEPWLIPSLMCVFFVIVNLGCSAVPQIIYGEIFPLPVREIGLGLGGIIMSVLVFSYLKIIPYLHLNVTFVVIAISMTVGLAYLYFALPETKDRTLQEIEDYFDHGRFLDDDEPLEDLEAKVTMLDPIKSSNS